MANDAEARYEASPRQLERVWNRGLWSVLTAIAVLADVGLVLTPPIAPLNAFFVGVYNGLAIAGLAMSLRRD